MELKEKVSNAVGENNLEKALSLLFDFQEIKDTAYYKDIIALRVIYSLYKENIALGVLSGADQLDLLELIKIELLKIAESIELEQKSIPGENYDALLKEFKTMSPLLSPGITEERIEDLNLLLSKFHSRHKVDFSKMLNMKYDPESMSIGEFRSFQVNSILNLFEKIRIEKELIHKGILRAHVLEKKQVIHLIDLFLKGEVGEAFEEIEMLSVKNLISRHNSNPQSLYGEIHKIRKPLELNGRYQEIYKALRLGMISSRKFILQIKSLVMELFDYLETTGR